jgi:hypothetical protein
MYEYTIHCTGIVLWERLRLSASKPGNAVVCGKTVRFSPKIGDHFARRVRDSANKNIHIVLVNQLYTQYLQCIVRPSHFLSVLKDDLII